MIQNGYIGDLQRVADAASILRPPETVNVKGNTRTPVTVLGAKADIPNASMLDALTPFLSATATTVVDANSALAGGAPHALFASIATSAPNMNAAAKVPGLDKKQDFKFIATQCAQVRTSLANNGAGDAYPLWHNNHLLLTRFCNDSDHWAHEISKGHIKYNKAAVDVALAATDKKINDTDLGPPRCSAYDSARPGICGKCPFNGKVVSPWNLGSIGGDMPDGYRHNTNTGNLEKHTRVKDPEDPKEYIWVWKPIMAGDAWRPIVDGLDDGGYAINFLYEFAGKQHAVRVEEKKFPVEKGGIIPLLTGQSMCFEDEQAVEVRRFIVAWIKMVRQNRQVRDERIHGFGYSTNPAGDLTGVALAGKLYRPDGSIEVAPGADPQNVAYYTPRGQEAKWRATFDAVCAGRPDQQSMVAASLASPLMRFTGQPGVVFSAWGESGAGKSSALKVGAAVFAHPLSLKSGSGPTINSFVQQMCDTAIYMLGWDEFQLGKSVTDMVALIMDMAQGVSKGRLDAQMMQRVVRQWQLMIVISANKPIMDHIGGSNSSTDATALRAFEMEILKPAMAAPSDVALMVDDLKDNYGHVGVKYIAHIAKSLPTLRDELKKRMVQIQTKVNADANERLYVACVATILVAADHANKLGICKFDIAGMTKVLLDTFLKLRDGRAKSSLMHGGKFNIVECLSRFHSQYFRNKLVTSHFRVRGPLPKDWGIPHTMQGTDRVEIHASVKDNAMRINKHTFVEWCKENTISQTVALDAAVKQLGAREDVKVLGDGTLFAGGRTSVIEIPLGIDLETIIPDHCRPGGVQPSQVPTTVGAPQGVP